MPSVHVAILLFLGLRVVGLNDLIFNQESAEVVMSTYLKETVPMLEKWLELLVIQQIP